MDAYFKYTETSKKKKIKVVFTGEGGDEIFGGYVRYKRQLNLLKKKKLNFSDHVIQLYKREINLFNKFNNYYKIEDIKKKFKSNLKKIKLNSQSYQNNILEFDQLTWLPMLLIKHDLIGMHYSLEVRPQILDHKIVEYVNNFIPSKLKFNKNYNKIFLKKFLIKFNKFRVKRKKGTPSISKQILLNKKYLEIFKNTLKNSLFLKKYFNAELFKNDAIYNSENMIFLWRLFIVSLMFSYKR